MVGLGVCLVVVGGLGVGVGGVEEETFLFEGLFAFDATDFNDFFVALGLVDLVEILVLV
jgi:hypothetical protein